ncbi:MAG TPA: class I SAM-dependent methyltransferase [Candidatus Limnocylindrales bacterium]
MFSMKVRTEVSPEKLRGGFYSPPQLVAECLKRIAVLTRGRDDLRVLEPTAGDGAFIRGLADHEVGTRVGFIEMIEVLPSEAAQAYEALEARATPGAIFVESVLAWSARNRDGFDVAIGNPPFVRFQFLLEEDKAVLPQIAARLNLSLRGVSNLWIPVLLVALASLREGGAFAFIVPSELFTGISARTVRTWLFDETADLQAQLFPTGSFPGVLQEVIVLSGSRKRTATPRLTLMEREPDGDERSWEHTLDRGVSTWTRYLLSATQLEAFVAAGEDIQARTLGSIAKFEVAAVTGANEFFSVASDTIDEYQLRDWARPLLPKARLAPGLRYTLADHEIATDGGARTALLDFSPELPDPLEEDGPRRYLLSGEDAGLDKRYKTRIRSPWYRIPHIRPGRLMLSKRSHYFPRLILNEANVVTTDTIYRGWMRPGFEGREEDLAAVFHNSLTLLSAEVEGRSFGGGVLELVPSEIARLVVPLVASAGVELDRLSTAPLGEDAALEGLVGRTDKLLLEHSGFDPSALEVVRCARLRLQSRRLERTVGMSSPMRGTNLA